MEIWNNENSCPEGRSKCPSDAALTDLLLGRLPEEETADVEDVFAACSICAQRCEELTTNDAFVGELRDNWTPSEAVAQSVRLMIAVLARSSKDSQTPLADLKSTIARDARSDDTHPESTGSTSPALPRRFGDYELLAEIARGGMGVIYKARHLPLDRIVALKMILAGHLAGDTDVERFYSEARLAGELAHPHIVPVHDVGEESGQHFIAMAFVEGVSLKDRISDGPLPAKEAAELTRSLAIAVQAAHDRGIIHRDLKPANVMLQAGDANVLVPRITDFGLAKRIDAEESPTLSGQIMGTPPYMPPEQARGDAASFGPGSDIYSLGATLYEMLTGRPPFRAASVMETLQQVIEQDPPSPRQLNPAIDRDLETICLKCLEKDPANRYRTASALADDLERYTKGAPISARPVGRVEWGWRWAKRYPARAGLGIVAVVAVAAVVGLVVAFDYQRLLENQKDELARSYKQESKLRGERDESLAKQRVLFGQLRGKKREVDRLLYRDQIKLALSEWNRGDVARARALLSDCPAELREWEWHYAYRTCNPEIRTIDAHTDMIRRLLFSPDGKRLFSCGGRKDKTIRIWDVASGKLLHELKGHQDLIYDLALSPDGKRLASAGWDRTVKIWDTDNGQCTLTYSKHSHYVTGVSFHHGGRLVASSSLSQSDSIRVFDSTSGETKFSLPHNGLPLAGIAYRPKSAFSNGDSVAATIFSRTPKRLGVWDLNSGKSKMIFEMPLMHLTKVRFDSAGHHLATLGESQLACIWELSTKKKQVLQIHGVKLLGLDFSPKGRKVITAMGDGTVQMWRSSPHGKVLPFSKSRTFRGHTAAVMSVAFHPSKPVIASGDRNGTIKLWSTQEGLTPKTPAEGNRPGGFVGAAGSGELWSAIGPGRSSTYVALSDDWKLIANVDNRDQQIRIWDAQTGTLIRKLTHPRQDVFSLEFSAGGQKVAAGFRDRTVLIWNVRDGKRELTLRGHSKAVNGIAFHPGGLHIATASADGTIGIWDAATGTRLHVLKGHSASVACIAYSPTGEWLASAGADNTVNVRDARVYASRFVDRRHTSAVSRLQFSRDSRRLASGAADGTIWIWNAADGSGALQLRGHSGRIQDLEFAPNDRRIATKADDRTIRVWELNSGHEMFQFKQQAARQLVLSNADLSFHADGKRLGAASAFRFRVWDARSGQWSVDE